MDIKRGDLFVAALDPTVGREISKTRPVLIVSNDQNNRFSATVTILPITSGSLDKIYPFEILLPAGTGNLPKASKIKADQIRTLDKTRLLMRIGGLGNPGMRLAEKAIAVHLALSPDPVSDQE